MSKVMQREMVVTTCKVAKTVVGEGGFPILEPLGEHTIIGGVTQPQAERIIRERIAQDVRDGAPEGSTNDVVEAGIKTATDGLVVFGLESKTDVYELDVETFFKYARVQVKLTDEEKAAKEKAALIEKHTKAVSRATELHDKAVKRLTEIDADIVKVTNDSQQSTDETEVAKFADKLAALQERKTKAEANVTKRQTELAAAMSDLTKSQQ